MVDSVAQYFDDLYIELPVGSRLGRPPADLDNLGIARWDKSDQFTELNVEMCLFSPVQYNSQYVLFSFLDAVNQKWSLSELMCPRLA